MHGADFGRVLVGFEIPPGDEPAFQAYLDGLHYPYVNETGNPAYRMFL
jgi:threonine dehydratase